jgi:dihydroorotate dehydrogenase electron transfer subunit
MIEAGDSYDPLLKRPFSFFRKTSGGIQFLYTAKGKGTSLMKDYRPGKVLSIIGPLGTGYPKPEKGVIPLFVAGGTGIASIFSLAEKFSKRSCLMYGAKCKDELLIINELKCLCNKPIVCTDDGSVGEKCTAADLLNNFVNSR